MAERLPAWIKPDHLTAMGLLSALIISASYALTTLSYNWLWLANFGLVAHWWADSLDGTLARVRHIERDRYGFFVDHFSDTVAQFLICLGMGLSPLMDLRIALMLLTAYYAMSILVYLVQITRGVFKISFAGIGPTEVRLIVIIVNTVVWYFDNPLVSIGRWKPTLFSLIGIVAAVLLMGAYLVFGGIERHRLAQADPPRTPDVSSNR